MHILLIHQVFVRPDDPGGTRHFEFAQRLVRLGHRVTILASPYSYQTGLRISDRKQELLEPGLEVIRCDVMGSMHRSFLHRTLGFFSFMMSSLWEGLRQPDVDLVWGTSPPLPQVVAAWLVARFKRAAFLFEVRDLLPAFGIQMGVIRNPLIIRVLLTLESFLYHRADRLVVNSPGFIMHLQSKGAKPEKISLVMNGVDTSIFHPESQGIEFRRTHHLEGKFVAMYAGAHGMANDLGVLLDAAELVKDDPRITFVFMGDGKEKINLIERAARMNLTRVLFLPPVAKNDIPEAMAACDCGVAILAPIPLFGTTYPNKVFDYMAAGRPLVLAIEGVIRKVVEEAEAGLCVPPGNPQALAAAIRKLAADTALAREMGRRGRECVERDFQREALARQMEKAILETVSAR